jgi:hypothetical protein
LEKIGPVIFIHKLLIDFSRWFGRMAGLRTNFFSSGLIFLAGLSQESWWDMATVIRKNKKPTTQTNNMQEIQFCQKKLPFYWVVLRKR